MWRWSVLQVLLHIEVAAGGKLIVPLLAETPYEWVFEELINAHFVFAAEHFGAFADFPSVIVDRGERVVFLDACRVEIARDGLLEVDAALTVGAVDGALAHATRSIAGKDAVFAVDYGGDKFAVGVEIGNAIFLDFPLCLRQQVVPNVGQNFLEFLELIVGYRCSGVALDAASAFAGIDVAAKESFGQFGADHGVAYLKHSVQNLCFDLEWRVLLS